MIPTGQDQATQVALPGRNSHLAPHARHAKCLPVYGSWVLVRTVTGLKSAGVACICIRCPRILQSSGVVRAGCWHGPREILKSAESSHQTICIELPNLQSPNRTSPFHYIIPWSHFIASSPGPHQPPSFASSSQICKVESHQSIPLHHVRGPHQPRVSHRPPRIIPSPRCTNLLQFGSASCRGSAPAPEFRIGRREIIQARIPWNRIDRREILQASILYVKRNGMDALEFASSHHFALEAFYGSASLASLGGCACFHYANGNRTKTLAICLIAFLVFTISHFSRFTVKPVRLLRVMPIQSRHVRQCQAGSAPSGAPSGACSRTLLARGFLRIAAPWRARSGTPIPP